MQTATIGKSILNNQIRAFLQFKNILRSLLNTQLKTQVVWQPNKKTIIQQHRTEPFTVALAAAVAALESADISQSPIPVQNSKEVRSITSSLLCCHCISHPASCISYFASYISHRATHKTDAHLKTSKTSWKIILNVYFNSY